MANVPPNATMVIDDEISLDASDPRSMLALLSAFGINFVIRSNESAQALFKAISGALSGIMAPASDLHFACGPSEARVLMQILELPDGEVIFAASCTGENMTTRATAWLVENVAGPLQSVGEQEGRAFEIVSAGNFDTNELRELIPGGRVVSIALLSAT
jgi:hypothetical protein